MQPANHHLAEFNIARIRFPLDDPRMAEFVDNVDRVHRVASQIEGFVWRLQDETGHAMNIRVYDDETILPNLTVWENVEALERFVWQTVHGRFFKRREEWFAKIENPLVLWWIPAGYRPPMSEGEERLNHYRQHGSTDYAFGWERLPGAKLWRAAHGTRASEHAA